MYLPNHRRQNDLYRALRQSGREFLAAHDSTRPNLSNAEVAQPFRSRFRTGPRPVVQRDFVRPYHWFHARRVIAVRQVQGVADRGLNAHLPVTLTDPPAQAASNDRIEFRNDGLKINVHGVFLSCSVNVWVCGPSARSPRLLILFEIREPLNGIPLQRQKFPVLDKLCLGDYARLLQLPPCRVA
jgi:hypothetical protein